MSRYRSAAQAAACREDVAVVTSAADVQHAATGTYPTSVADLAARGYLRTAPATGVGFRTFGSNASAVFVGTTVG